MAWATWRVCTSWRSVSSSVLVAKISDLRAQPEAMRQLAAWVFRVSGHWHDRQRSRRARSRRSDWLPVIGQENSHRRSNRKVSFSKSLWCFWTASAFLSSSRWWWLIQSELVTNETFSFHWHHTTPPPPSQAKLRLRRQKKEAASSFGPFAAGSRELLGRASGERWYCGEYDRIVTWPLRDCLPGPRQGLNPGLPCFEL